MDDAPNPIAAAQITAAMNAFMVLPLEGHASCSVKLAGSDASEVSLRLPPTGRSVAVSGCLWPLRACHRGSERKSGDAIADNAAALAS
jgi:hypothetical protein